MNEANSHGESFTVDNKRISEQEKSAGGTPSHHCTSTLLGVEPDSSNLRFARELHVTESGIDPQSQVSMKHKTEDEETSPSLPNSSWSSSWTVQRTSLTEIHGWKTVKSAWAVWAGHQGHGGPYHFQKGIKATYSGCVASCPIEPSQFNFWMK